DLDLGRDVAEPDLPAVYLRGQGGADLLDQVAQGEALAVQLRRALAREGQRLRAEVDGAVDGGEQGRRHLLDLRVVAAGEAVCHQLGRGQDVAEIVVDLGDGGAERGQARLLLQGGAQLRLHVRKLMLGDTELVGARRGRQRARQILRVLAEA